MHAIVSRLGLLAATATLLLANACDKKEDTSAADKKEDKSAASAKSSDSPAGRMASLEKEACACKDIACADAVREKWKAMDEDLKKLFPKKEEAPKDLIKTYLAHKKATRECRAKLSPAATKAPAATSAPKPAGGAAGAATTACSAAHKAFRETSASEADKFRTAMMNVMTRCGAACGGGDKTSCARLDGFSKSLCKVSPAICKKLCGVLKAPATKAALCKYAPK